MGDHKLDIKDFDFSFVSFDSNSQHGPLQQGFSNYILLAVLSVSCRKGGPKSVGY